MDEMIIRVSWDEVVAGCKRLAENTYGMTIWGVPRGGVIIVGIMSYMGCELRLGSRPFPGDIVVDDIVDTGYTCDMYSNHRFMALISRGNIYGSGRYPSFTAWTTLSKSGYVLFPWENEKHIMAELAKQPKSLRGRNAGR